jgi:hypothetical protein
LDLGVSSEKAPALAQAFGNGEMPVRFVRFVPNSPAGASGTLRQGGPNGHSLLQNCDDRNNSEFHFLTCREVKQRYQWLRGCGEDLTLALI